MSKWLKLFFMFIFGGPLVAFILWYTITFIPYLSELKLISSRGNESISSIEYEFYPIVVAGETSRGIRSWAMRQAYWSLIWNQNPGRTLSWHANNILWFGASYFHFNEHEIFGLWVECAIQPCNSGLKKIAQNHFGKELTELPEKQLARLVALVESPSMYGFGTELGEKRANEILEKTKSYKSVTQKE